MALHNFAAARQLNGKTEVLGRSATRAACMAVCADYLFFGLQFGEECMCGNSFHTFDDLAWPTPNSKVRLVTSLLFVQLAFQSLVHPSSSSTAAMKPQGLQSIPTLVSARGTIRCNTFNNHGAILPGRCH